MRKHPYVITAVLLLAGSLDAHEFKAGSITVEHPWARPAASGNSAAYFTLDNEGSTPDRLIGVTSAVAGRAEMHSTTIDAQGVGTMRPVQAVDLPAGGEARFAPGGLHVMLVGVTAPLVEGEEFPLTLSFEQAGKVTVAVEVEKRASHGGAGAADHDHGKTQPTQ
jgi:periplasmic copper chaperone A